MKKHIKFLIVFTAAMSLCACADDAVFTDMPIEEPTEPATLVYTGIPELPDFDSCYDDRYTTAYDHISFDTDEEDPTEEPEENHEKSENTDDRSKEHEEKENEKDEKKEKENEKKPESKPDNGNKDNTEKDEKLTENEAAEDAPKDDTEKNDKKNDKKDESKKANCIDVPFISQAEFPTGCELVSASMLLKFRGIDLSAGELYEKYMPKAEFEKKNGKLYGGDPNKAYIGDPTADSGYGCYSGALIKGFEKLFKDGYCDILDLGGMSLSDICWLYIDSGEPVLIWASIDMAEFTEKDDSKWLITGTDKEFVWLGNEHCLVLVGYDDENYYFNDPLKSKNFAYKKAVVEKRYEELGRQAVTVRPW